MDLRCGPRLHGRLDNGFLEFKCNSARCGSKDGVVVLHYFSATTGEFIETRRFKDPAFSVQKKEVRNGTSRIPPVRTP